MKAFLNIYLLKAGVKEFKDIVNDKYEEYSFKKYSNMRFYYKHQDEKPVKWIDLFKNEVKGDLSGNTQSASGVLVVKYDNRFFAFTFGYGRHMLNDELFEERFGLRTALNSIDEDKIKKADIKNIEARSRRASIQSDRLSSVEDLEIHTDRDILGGVSGKCNYSEKFGEKITGSLALHLYVEFNLETIDVLCKDIFLIYSKKDYRKKFSWIDRIQPIRAKKIVEMLNGEMIKYINDCDDDFEKLFLAPPTVVNWEKFGGFKYSRQRDNLHSDIFMKDFIEFVGKKKTDISMDVIKTHKIYCLDNAGDLVIDSWSVYTCINFRTVLSDKEYMLTDGEWFEIELDYIKKINKAIDKIEDYDQINFPDYTDKETEGVYNQRIAETQAKCLIADKKNVLYGGNNSKIELCDILYNNKDFIHVKVFHGSSTLSHLFLQGLNSIKLFLNNDKNFMAGIIKQIPEASFKKIPDKKDHTLVFAIISNSKYSRPSEVLPFFSRVSLDGVLKDLNLIGVKVKWKKIDIVKETINKITPIKTKKDIKDKK